MKNLMLLCLVCSPFFLSCEEIRLKKEVDILTGIEIVVPENMECLLFGKNTVVPEYPGTCVRLVAYYDSTGCASCAINKLDYWDKVVAMSASTARRFVPIFVFAPGKSKIDETSFALKTTTFNYPLYLDTTGIFGKMNHSIPDNPLLHTFLLDRDNRVVLVGDPSANGQLWDLYVTTINMMLENNGVLE